jgi:MFS family permease
VNIETHKWKVLLCAFFAYAFDVGDMMAITIVIPLLMKEWGIDMAMAGLISTASLAGCAIGAFFWGPLSDQIGRKRAYIYCILSFTLFTVLTGFCNDLTTLLIVRFLCGIGLGGAWILGTTLVSEFFPPDQRAKATGFIQAASPIGVALILWTTAYLVPIYSWRAVFYIGALAFILVVYMAVCLPESPLWVRAKFGLEKGTNVPAEQMKISVLFSKKLIKSTILSTLLVVSCLVAYWGAGSWIPTFLTVEKGFDIKTMSGYMLALNFGGFFGYLGYGYIADKWGRRCSFLIGPTLAGLMALIFVYGTTAGNALLLATLFGFFTYGYWGPLGAYVSEQYPTVIRGTGLAFAWGTGRTVAALVPVVLGSLAMKTSLQFCIGLMSVVFLSGAVFAYFMKETKDQVIS